MDFIAQDEVNMDVLIKCMLCLKNVKISGFSKHYLSQKQIAEHDYYTDIEFISEDLIGKKVDGFTDNGVLRISNYDVSARELNSASLLHRIAKLALLQGYITKDRYEKRFGFTYHVAKMYNQVSQELLADILKHVFETQMLTPTRDQISISNLIGYDIQKTLKVNLFTENKNALPIKGSYTSEDIERLQMSVVEDLDEGTKLDNEDGKELAVRKIREKNNLVKTSIQYLDECKAQTINKFNKKYAYKLCK